MSRRAEALRHIVRKTIAGVVIRNNPEAGPRDQFFIVFTDNTYLEFYGDVSWSSNLEIGNLEKVKHDAARLGGNSVVLP